MKIFPIFPVAMCFFASLAMSQNTSRPFELMAGDPAPALEVEQWIKGDPVDGFESGQVYVVELWATWCGPCRKAIGHMSELQEEYGDRVRFIGVSIWEKEPAKVSRFVKKMGDKMKYTVAREKLVDGEGRSRGVMASTWMEPSGRWMDGIPSAFIVDGDGKIAWIGDPFTLDEPLAKIVDGSWDVAEFIQENLVDWTKKGKAVIPHKTFSEAMDAENWSRAAEALDQLLEIDAEEFSWAAGKKFKLLAITMNDAQKATDFGRRALNTFAKDQPQTLNYIAWTIVSPEDGVEPKDLDLAFDAAQRCNDLTNHEIPAFIDTLARVYFEKGNRKKAIELQQKAVDMLEGEEKAMYQEVLDSYRADNS